MPATSTRATTIGALLLPLLASAALVSRPATGPQTPVLDLRDEARVAIVGNAFVERLGMFGSAETMLLASRPEAELRVTCLGWPADTVSLRPRPLNFGDLHDDLARVRADVVVLCFGMTESFSGEPGLDGFARDLDALLTEISAHSYNGHGPPVLALVSPIAHEDLGPPLPHPAAHDAQLVKYVETMRAAAREHGIVFVDLYGPSVALVRAGGDPLTFDGILPTAYGEWALGPALVEGLGIAGPPWRIEVDATSGAVVAEGVEVLDTAAGSEGVTLGLLEHTLRFPSPPAGARVAPPLAERLPVLAVAGLDPGTYALHLDSQELLRADHDAWRAGVRFDDAPGRKIADDVRALVVEKNRQWFFRWRAVNGEYIYGRRAEPFGVVSFPPEMETLDGMIDGLHERIAATLAAGLERSLQLVRVD